MFRRVAVALVAAAAIALTASSAASAADNGDQNSSSSTTASTNYTPRTPTQPTLDGSTVTTQCVRDVPWISFTVGLIDPNDLSTSHTARLVITDGAHHSVVVPLGDLVDNKLSGRVLWPGAAVDKKGNAAGWPGWVEQNGQWVQTDDPQYFGWTRGAITAEIEVNPHVVVPLSYPPATAKCASPDPKGALSSLPVTGLGVAVMPIGVAGGAIAIVGVFFLVARRLRTRRS